VVLGQEGLVVERIDKTHRVQKSQNYLTHNHTIYGILRTGIDHLRCRNPQITVKKRTGTYNTVIIALSDPGHKLFYSKGWAAHEGREMIYTRK
jgi:hypothetical protein